MNTPTKIILSILIAAGLFYGGFAYGKSTGTVSTANTSTSAYSGRTGRTGSTTNSFSGGSAITGSVVSKDATSITIAEKTGSAVVFYSTSTPVMKTVAGTSDDIAAGDAVVVIGTANPDGSITANSIQLRQATGQ
jgi:hypothetical protein